MVLDPLTPHLTSSPLVGHCTEGLVPTHVSAPPILLHVAFLPSLAGEELFGWFWGTLRGRCSRPVQDRSFGLSVDEVH